MQLHYGLNDLKEMDFAALAPIVLPLFAVAVILILIALIDLYRNKKIRNNVLVWTLIILLVIPLGPIVYFMFGRKDMKK